MSELNQLLLELDYKTNFNEHDFYISKSNSNAFNLIDQDSKYMLINSLIPISEIKYNLPDLASRSKNCLYAVIENPDDELLFAIILKNFSDRQIKIEKKIINFIISRIDRSYRKIEEFIYKIDELSLKKKKPINFKTIKEIL